MTNSLPTRQCGAHLTNITSSLFFSEHIFTQRCNTIVKQLCISLNQRFRLFNEIVNSKKSFKIYYTSHKISNRSMTSAFAIIILRINECQRSRRILLTIMYTYLYYTYFNLKLVRFLYRSSPEGLKIATATLRHAPCNYCINVVSNGILLFAHIVGHPQSPDTRISIHCSHYNSHARAQTHTFQEKRR